MWVERFGGRECIACDELARSRWDGRGSKLDAGAGAAGS